jgi:hypothetical protein
MTTANARRAIVLLAVLVIGACSASESTAPTGQLRPTPSVRDDGDTIPNSQCISGYSGANGICT